MIACPTTSSTTSSWDNIERTSRKRRSCYDSPDGGDTVLSCESSPLEVDVNLSSINYATFSDRQPNKQGDHNLPYWWWLLLSASSSSLSSKHTYFHETRKKPHQPSRYPYYRYYHLPAPPNGRVSPLGCNWKLLYTTLILVGLTAVYYKHFQNSGGGNPYFHSDKLEPEAHWEWDHNIYMPTSTTTKNEVRKEEEEAHQSSSFVTGSLLIAQMSLGTLTDISSRPNRAYARQHVMDYVRYSSGGRSFHKQCFDKVILLNMILDKQLRATGTGNNKYYHHHNDENLIPMIPSPSLFALPERIDYDAVALLPPDSIITSMDSEIFDLLPQDKLVAIAGWSNQDSMEESSNNRDGGGMSTTTTLLLSKTDVVFFNLRHKYANAVAKLWWDWVEPPEVSCGAGNDLSLLVDAIASVLEEGETLSSVIAPLVETDQGFVSSTSRNMSLSSLAVATSAVQQDYIIKGIAPATPEPRARLLLTDVPDVRVQLQTTADSVCYRFYPRCEVL